MTTIDTADYRFAKAIAIADQAGQWFRCQTAEGKRFGIPSSRDPNHYYLVSRTACTCEDAKRHASPTCKHALAVQIHCARVAGTPMSASDVVDGLAQMVTERHAPVLNMIREADGSIRWDRHEHASGDTYYLPRRQAASDPSTAALAQRQSDIFSTFVGD